MGEGDIFFSNVDTGKVPMPNPYPYPYKQPSESYWVTSLENKAKQKPMKVEGEQVGKRNWGEGNRSTTYIYENAIMKPLCTLNRC